MLGSVSSYTMYAIRPHSKPGSLAISLFQYSRVSKFSCNMKLIFKLNQVHVCDADAYALWTMKHDVGQNVNEWRHVTKITQNIQQELTSRNLRHYRNTTVSLTGAFTCSLKISFEIGETYSQGPVFSCVEFRLRSPNVERNYMLSQNQSVPWYARFADMAWNYTHCHYIAGYSS